MVKKNDWLLNYFFPHPDSMVQKINGFLMDSTIAAKNKDLEEAQRKLKQYCSEYEESISKKIKSARVKCDRCVPQS